ncbi:MAG: methionyl-tRNA formyltransferase [Gemmobacter sp.]|nr:methionyl-tRNA formyltransferase [Gemmobacter sp.]
MRVVFAGTPEFARIALERLQAAGFEIPLILTQPDRPAGRGMKLQSSPVKQFALEHGISVAQPRSLRLDGRFPDEAAAAREALLAARPDVMVVAAYGLILPQWVLELPQRGCLNIHASLLPRWRGAAPIHRAIEAGDATTGVTIMQMDAGLDTGDMLLTESVPISGADTAGALHDRLAELGGRMVVEALELVACGGLRPVPQPAEGVTYAAKIDKAEAVIDWARPAAELERRARALSPTPGQSTTLDGEGVKVWRVAVDAAGVPAGVPGQVLAVGADGIRVATGEGVLTLLELQRAGGKRLPAREFLQGFALAPGQVFGAVA